MPVAGTTDARGYGAAYQKARKRLLKGNPPCFWCGKPATTADHVPPLTETGRSHLNLVPACGPCNFGRVGAREVEPSRKW